MGNSRMIEIVVGLGFGVYFLLEGPRRSSLALRHGRPKRRLNGRRWTAARRVPARPLTVPSGPAGTAARACRPGQRAHSHVPAAHGAPRSARGPDGRRPRGSLGDGLRGTGRAATGRRPLRPASADGRLRAARIIPATDHRTRGRALGDGRGLRARPRRRGQHRGSRARRHPGPARGRALSLRARRPAGLDRGLPLSPGARRLHARHRGPADRLPARQAARDPGQRDRSDPSAGRGGARARRRQPHDGRGVRVRARRAPSPALPGPAGARIADRGHWRHRRFLLAGPERRRRRRRRRHSLRPSRRGPSNRQPH